MSNPHAKNTHNTVLAKRQNGYRIGIVLAQLLLLTSCFKDTTINAGLNHPEWVGTWSYFFEERNGGVSSVSNVQLHISNDGSVDYGYCEATNDRDKKTTSTQSQVITDAKLIHVSKDQLVIENSLAVFHFETTIDVEFGPFAQNGTDYVGIRGRTLTKVKQPTLWGCP